MPTGGHAYLIIGRQHLPSTYPAQPPPLPGGDPGPILPGVELTKIKKWVGCGQLGGLWMGVGRAGSAAEADDTAGGDEGDAGKLTLQQLDEALDVLRMARGGH
jgi:hypothetical protein